MSFPSKTGRNAAIIRAFKQGARYKDLAEQYGLSTQRIGRILIRAGVASGRNGRPPLAFANEAERRTYRKLRSIIGYQAAREELKVGEPRP